MCSSAFPSPYDVFILLPPEVRIPPYCESIFTPSLVYIVKSYGSIPLTAECQRLHETRITHGRAPRGRDLRRFHALNARNLLYLQAELAGLETSVEKACEADAQSGDRLRKRYDRDWRSLSESSIAPGGNPEQ